MIKHVTQKIKWVLDIMKLVYDANRLKNEISSEDKIMTSKLWGMW